VAEPSATMVHFSGARRQDSGGMASKRLWRNPLGTAEIRWGWDGSRRKVCSMACRRGAAGYEIQSLHPIESDVFANVQVDDG